MEVYQWVNVRFHHLFTLKGMDIPIYDEVMKDQYIGDRICERFAFIIGENGWNTKKM